MDESTFLNPSAAIRAAKVHEGMKVADFGAGSGFFTRASARAVGERGVVWAVDANRDLLPRIKSLALAEGLHNVEVMHGNVERVQGSNLPDDTFDFCLAANVLFGCEDKQGLFKEIHRILHRGGKALLIDWSASHGGLGPHPDHVITAEAARALCEQNGFTYVEDIPAGAYHWGFVAKKQI